MTRFGWLAAVLPLACGGAGPDAAWASLSLALSEDVAARVESLQVALVPSSASVDCAKTSARCLVDQAVNPQPLSGENEGKLALRVPWSLGDGDGLLSLEVASGVYLVHVEALDGQGGLVANGCRLKVELRNGETSDAEVTLAAFAGASCVAAR